MHQRHKKDAHGEKVKVTNFHKTTDTFGMRKLLGRPEVMLHYAFVAKPHLHIQAKVREPKGKTIEEEEKHYHAKQRVSTPFPCHNESHETTFVKKRLLQALLRAL
jgi:hypothetical protein